jgi:hypothetical protein
MTSTSIVCVACGADVAYGRLSCPECGELLASVAGGRRTKAAANAQLPPASASSDASGLPSVLHDVEPASRTLDDDDDVGQDPGNGHDALELHEPAGDLDEPLDADHRASHGHWYDPVAAFNASLTMAPAPVAAVGPPPGAYVPPPPASYAVGSTVQPAPARAWAGSSAGSNGTAGDDAGTATDGVGGLDTTKVDEFTGWLAVAGAALASVGFLLPWSNSIIGASGVGYFDRWGLAGPGHVVIVLGLLATLVLALVRLPVPVAIRVGIPALVLGAMLVGLVWPYAFGPLGAQPGVYAILVGAVLLLVAGVTGIVAGRHASPARSV